MVAMSSTADEQSERRVRIVVVDDSATVRSVLTRRLESDGAMEVVGVAADGLEALELIDELRPDIVTLDVEMPRLDGLATLARIMRECPTRVVMVSSVTREGADATIRALELGAVDFVEKPTYGGVSAPHAMGDELVDKLRGAAAARLPSPRRQAAPTPATPAPETSSSARWLPRKVVIGASTGGPQALREVITALPGDLGVPVAVVQHMPAGFTRSLAERLNEQSALRVEEATRGARMEAGKVLIAPGGLHMTIDRRGVVDLNEDALECGVRPAVNVTLESAVQAFGSDTLAVVLTGMGTDGTRGAGLIHAAGGEVIAESKETAVIWGMPGSVVGAGFADHVVPLHRVAERLVRSSRARRRRDGGR